MVFNNKEYTVVDVYFEENGKIVQLNSDDDVLLLFLEQNGDLRKLSQEEDLMYREKYGLIELDYVPATIKDIYNFELSAKKVSKAEEERFKTFFKTKLYGINPALAEAPYINQRLKAMSYRTSAKSNFFASNTSYLLANKLTNGWVAVHETVHGIVNKSTLPSYGIIEGITDRMVGLMMPAGNYSRNYGIVGGQVQINQPGFGQEELVVFAKQMEFALGTEYNLYEMFAYPHKQIKKFGNLYGTSKNRTLLHKINKVYRAGNDKFQKFVETQEYLLEMIFDKKFEDIKDTESATKYFNELINFGLLRARINGKDASLEEYYKKQIAKLKNMGIDLDKIPPYVEKEFYPCGDVYFNFNSYIKSLIDAKMAGKGEEFKILYNQDNTCVYIMVDGKLNFVQNLSIENKRKFLEKDFNDQNSKIVLLDNGNYLITAPDGVTEEVRDTHAEEIIDRCCQKADANRKGR